MLAIIMCSGLSRRMGKNKLLMKLNGKVIVEYVIENVLKSDFDEVIMVYGDEELKVIADKYKLKSIYNPLRELGQSEAIKLAIEKIDNHKGISFFMGDQPLLSYNTINLLLKEFNLDQVSIIASSYNGKMGAPVIFPSYLKDEFLKLEGDVGGKIIINNNASKLKKVEILNDYEGLDIDSPSDLKKLEEVIKKINIALNKKTRMFVGEKIE